MCRDAERPEILIVIYSQGRLCQPDERMPIYKVLMEEVRCRAVSPGDQSPVLMLRADCSLFTSKPAHSSPYLPAGLRDPSQENRFMFRSHRRNADSRTGCRRHRSVQHSRSLHYCGCSPIDNNKNLIWLSHASNRWQSRFHLYTHAG